MQFQLDIVPAIVGVSIYVFCQLLIKWLASPTKKSKLEQEVALQSEVADFADDRCYDDDEQDTEPSAEPEAEADMVPEAEVHPAPVPRRPVFTYLWRALAIVLIISRIALPLLSQSSSNPQQWHEEEPPTPVDSISSMDGSVSSADGQVAEAANVTEISETANEAAAEERLIKSGPELPQEPEWLVRGGEAAFSVKLTRQPNNDEDYIRSAYYGILQVGTPPITMTVVFDTGSGHLVLPSMFCKSDTCKAHTRYRRSASKSARDIDTTGDTWQSGPRDSVTVSFGTGEITGVFIEDVICMGDVSNVSDHAMNVTRPECTRLHFVAATELSEDPFKGFHFDGILGLGLSGLSQAPGFNFMEVMGQSIGSQFGGKMPHTFGVFLANHEFEDSEVALGGWSQQHVREDLSWGPISDPEMGHWITPIKGLRVDNEPIDFCSDGNCKAAVDTGTTLLAVPTRAFRDLYEPLRHSAPLAGHCRGFGRLLHFELEHFTVTLGPKDYGQVKKTHKSLLRKPSRLFGGAPPKGRADLRCLPMLMTLDLEEPVGPKLFVLGEPVLRKYYTVYDSHRKRVAFGRAKHIPAPTREDLLEMAVDVSPTTMKRLPNMFDIFRWRKAFQ
mmetsp:Transcript_87555/g.276736  ORF Transcript_87555/g.276736 Transcript_87555/m.276736 type:complete len:614 (-) Transcript_87555:184-2025(-)|eukprot:CAMPEP_0175641020 /NCGR_PEP_ID=MMETSP0097-20121207/4543_1 /TAXON_ID=311494 /ORGANISM="Alexandrium monilatum, Strain CCMP3105" /LENGTH=613 /DNA_ID=CAMNT_0016946779 /DNA_START=14 /DNA_END=1855 /DNA_ORIENTATION=-